MIPLVDLGAQHDRIKSELAAAIDEVFASRAFIQGRHVAEFERAFLRLHEVPHGVGCSNGTAALFLALAGLSVGPGDEVIVPAHTFIACGEAVRHVGARPVFADVDADTQCLDPAGLARARTPRTRAVLAVHLYGNPCDLDAIGAFAAEHGLLVIEDAAQAHLARYRGRPVGGFGDAATFSFYPGKNLGACGDAGFVMTRDPELRARMAKLLDHGREEKYRHDVVGYNFRMDGLQAAILLAKLRHLEAWTEARRRHVAHYDRLLAPAGFSSPRATGGADPVHHLYVVQVSNRDAVQRHLTENGIASGVHYPIPLHLQPAFADLGGRPGDLPVAERLAGRILSLPLYAELDPAQVERVAATFLEVARP